MLNKIIGTLFLFVFIISPAALWAKDFPPGKWWHNPKVSEKLNLSDEEIKTLDKEFADSRRKLIKLKSVVESEQFELDFLFDRESINKKDIMTQFDKFQKAKKNLAVERFRLIFEVRNILGLERFRQLKEFQKIRRRKMRQELKSLKNHLKERSGAKG